MKGSPEVKAKTNGALIIVALAALVALVFASCRPVAVEAAYPIEKAKSSIARRAWLRVTGAMHGARAAAEAARLRQELASLAILRTDLENLEAENARLRKALDYTEHAKVNWISAEVLSTGGGAAGAGKRIRVAKGSLAGVAEGQIVVAAEGLVGLVTSVTPHTAEVTLLADGAVKVACEIEVEGSVGDRPRGIIAGGSDELLILKYLTNAGKIPPRARVVTSGLGGVFPKGLEIGTLLDVRTDERGFAREGEVLPSVDCSSLEDVFIRGEK